VGYTIAYRIVEILHVVSITVDDDIPSKHDIFQWPMNSFPQTVLLRFKRGGYYLVFYFPVTEFFACFKAWVLTSLEILSSMRLSSFSAICSRTLR